jgi:hypothetical protein
MSQSIELEEIEVELDDTLTVNLTTGFVEFGTVEHTPYKPINIVSFAVGEAGDGSVSVTSENPLYQRKERQKTSKVWNDFDSATIEGVKKSQCN